MPNPIETGQHALTQKAGPLPVWGWVVVLALGGLATYYLFFRGSATTANTTVGGFPLGTGGSAGNSATPTPTTDTPAPTVTRLPNQDWIEAAIPKVATALGMDQSTVRYYLRQYLSGREPQGSSSAVNAFERVVQAAFQAVGQPQSSPFGSGQNPYVSNAGYLQDVFAFLPAGTTAAVRNELTALFNGSTTVISQDAANALDAVRNIIGMEPTIIGYTIRAPAAQPPLVIPTPPPVPPPVIPTPPVVPVPAPAPVVPVIEKALSTVVSGLFGSGSTTWQLTTVGPSSGGRRQVVIQHLSGAPGSFFGSIPPGPIQGFVDLFGNILDGSGRVLGNTGGAIRAAA